jgi:hypothetical protein
MRFAYEDPTAGLLPAHHLKLIVVQAQTCFRSAPAGGMSPLPIQHPLQDVLLSRVPTVLLYKFRNVSCRPGPHLHAQSSPRACACDRLPEYSAESPRIHQAGFAVARRAVIMETTSLAAGSAVSAADVKNTVFKSIAKLVTKTRSRMVELQNKFPTVFPLGVVVKAADGLACSGEIPMLACCFLRR